MTTPAKTKTTTTSTDDSGATRYAEMIRKYAAKEIKRMQHFKSYGITAETAAQIRATARAAVSSKPKRSMAAAKSSAAVTIDVPKQAPKKRKAKLSAVPVLDIDVAPAELHGDAQIIGAAMRALLRERYEFLRQEKNTYDETVATCRRMGISFETPAPL